MRRILIIILSIYLFSPLTSYAQFFDSYSITVIGNRSSIIAKKIDDFRNYKNGFGIGLHVQKTLTKHVSFLTGILISDLRDELDATQTKTGPNGMPTSETFGDKTTSSLFILSVPILAKINGPANFFGYVGPRLDFKLGSHNGFLEYRVEEEQIRQKDKLPDYAEFFVPGWTVGLGKRFNGNGFKPSIAFQYGGDLSKLIRDEGFINLKKRRFEILISIPLL